MGETFRWQEENDFNLGGCPTVLHLKGHVRVMGVYYSKIGMWLEC